jgi:hypothetical protein
MLRVRCVPIRGKADGWPQYVQALPRVGDMMERSPDHRRAYVEAVCFCPDGMIEIELRDDNS